MPLGTQNRSNNLTRGLGIYIGIYATSQRQTLHIAHEKGRYVRNSGSEITEMGKPTCEGKSWRQRGREWLFYKHLYAL